MKYLFFSNITKIERNAGKSVQRTAESEAFGHRPPAFGEETVCA